MSFEIISTINPLKLSQRFMNDLLDNGTTIIRLNGAHIQEQGFDACVSEIRRLSKGNCSILLDIPGTKIRTEGLLINIQLTANETFALNADNFNYPEFLNHLSAGDEVVSSDGQLKMLVQSVSEGRVEFRALCCGELLNHKGVHLASGDLSRMPFLGQRDYRLVSLALRHNIEYVGFSFVRSPEHVDEILHLLKGTLCRPIVKLETREVVNPIVLEKVIGQADDFLIDRGDLASEVGLAKFPSIFNRTMDSVIDSGKRLFVATQLFASMCTHNLPHLSEVIEFKRLFDRGVTGVQLSEEIAVGEHPVEVLKMMQTIMKGE